MKTQMHFLRRAVPDRIVVRKATAAGDAKSRQTHTFIFSESFPRDNQGSIFPTFRKWIRILEKQLPIWLDFFT